MSQEMGRRNPDPAEYEHFLGTGLIRVATCAAELPEAARLLPRGTPAEVSSVASLRARCGTPMQASMEFVLAVRDMSTEVIADGRHLSPELLNFAYRMKGASRLLLVSDCSRALDMRRDGGISAGRRACQFRAGARFMVRTMRAATDAPLPDLLCMASLTPAERLGMSDFTGSLAPGKRAAVLVLSEALEVERVFIGGEEFV